jgi:HAMP domain-containing protein
MNVRLSVGRVGNKAKGMRTAGWCVVFLVMVAGFTGSAVAAENQAATETALSVATNDAAPRTRATLTAHISADEGSLGSGELSCRENRPRIRVSG